MPVNVSESYKLIYWDGTTYLNSVERVEAVNPGQAVGAKELDGETIEAPVSTVLMA